VKSGDGTSVGRVCQSAEFRFLVKAAVPGLAGRLAEFQKKTGHPGKNE